MTDYDNYNSIYRVNTKSFGYCGRIVINSFYNTRRTLRKGKPNVLFIWSFQYDYIGSGDLLDYINIL